VEEEREPLRLPKLDEVLRVQVRPILLLLSLFHNTDTLSSFPGRPPQTTQIELSDETELGKIEKPKRRRSTSVKKQGEDEDDDFDPTGDDTKEAEASSQEEPSDYDEAESARPKKKPKPKVEKPHGRWGE